MATQPRATIEQTLGQLTPLWDDLCRRAGQTRTSADLDQLEHDAQRFTDAVNVAFRGEGARRSSAPALLITKTGAWW
ncbi:hypothetical protein [uncultured Sphingomonas sp.]|uniref:hypothetical protein n=1 Tax=uncultured Sphingomonas sp. TaxID=158754 RepID=UPI0037485FA8